MLNLYFQGYDYASVQGRAYCFCGDNYGSFGVADKSACNLACSGDSSQLCGGDWRNSVFKTGIMNIGVDKTGKNSFSPLHIIMSQNTV